MLEDFKYFRKNKQNDEDGYFNEVHVAGVTEKVIFEQRDEGSGKEPSRQVWRKYS